VRADAELVVVDELRGMELASAAFGDEVIALFERSVAVEATVHARVASHRPHPTATSPVARRGASVQAENRASLRAVRAASCRAGRSR
jgi:nucleoside-triphosphatase THEP1